MYGSASVAEELCHLNRWDKCSLPVNALETALELRQLDTLAFFLRSRETVAGECVQLCAMYTIQYIWLPCVGVCDACCCTKHSLSK